MTSPVVAVVAAALREHAMQSTTTGDCLCGEDNNGYPGYSAENFHRNHVATAVVEALGLKPEFAYMGQPHPDEDAQLDEWSCGHEIITQGRNYGVVHEGYDEPVRRFVTGWVAVDGITPK